MNEDSDSNPFARRIVLVVSYVGTRYRGWQIQPNGPSIQSALADAIEKVTGTGSVPIGSGRTDAGVHALAQVAHFDSDSKLPAQRIVQALNFYLPADIVVQRAWDAPTTFHARKSAISKLYRYLIHDGTVKDVFLSPYCWKVRGPLDVAAMRSAAAYIVGTHDFRCFETEWPNRASSVRTVTACEVSRLGDFISIDVEANGFLYNMVRSITGTLRNVGRGRIEPIQVRETIAAGDRSKAGPTAPARGLFLVRVEYGTGPEG